MRIGLDIGGTKTDAVLLDAAYGVRRRVRIPTGRGAEAVLATAVRAVDEVLLGESEPADSIGIGIPGVVDEASGRVSHAVNLAVAELPLGELLRRRIGVPVRVENDVKAAALGAWHLLSLSGSAAYLNLGTGLAAGIVVDGAAWRGAFGGAGEIGHIPVEPDGAVCTCGQRGCLETIASGSGVARWWSSDSDLPVLDLFDAADAGDAHALAVRARFAAGVAAAVRILALTVDVETVVIGGGLSNLGGRLLDVLRETLSRDEAGSPFLASLHLPERVRLVPQGTPVAAVGAALVGVAEDAAAGVGAGSRRAAIAPDAQES